MNNGIQVGDTVELTEDLHLKGKLKYEKVSSLPRDIDTVIKAGTSVKVYWYEPDTGRMNILINGVCVFIMENQIRKKGNQ